MKELDIYCIKYCVYGFYVFDGLNINTICDNYVLVMSIFTSNQNYWWVGTLLRA